MLLLRRILRDPLTHFLVVGAALFLSYALIHGTDSRSADETTIVVDEAALLKYMQYRSQAFEPEYFIKAYKAMSSAEKQQLVDTYVREEAMSREAKAMGLEDVDYVIRQRLIQKMLFLIDSTSTEEVKPTDKELQAWFEQHEADYRIAETMTFTHVFIDDEKRHAEGGEQAARATLARLNAAHAGFNDAPEYGDRFPYLQNYIDRDPDFIVNQFGKDFADALEKLKPSDKWQGPIRSQFGWHLILLTRRIAAAEPKFADVREQVESDYRAQQNAELRKRAIDDLLSNYTVKIVNLPGVAAPGQEK